MKIEDHEKINELMRKTTSIGIELLEIQRGICDIQNGVEVANKEYFELLDAYLAVVNTELARGAVFEKLTNIAVED